MKAIKIKKPGGPEILELEDITLRKPVKDEVLIEHVAIGLNYIDTYHRSGLYPLKLPSGLGLEGAGIIIEVGSEIRDYKIGDKFEAGIVLKGSEVKSLRNNRVDISHAFISQENGEIFLKKTL